MLLTTATGFQAGLSAQGATLSFETDEEEEFDLPEVEDVTISVDGEEFDMEEDMEFERNKVMDVSIRFLRPHSWVAVHLQKAGMKLTKVKYQANEKGELDLEVKTGKKKIKGTAKIYYNPNGAARIERIVKVKVI